jgi:Cu/Ag efflux pump CusA
MTYAEGACRIRIDAAADHSAGVCLALEIAALFQAEHRGDPDLAPVILEITAPAAGQPAEAMERYYTIPIEVGLSTTPGIDVMRSTSFYVCPRHL